LALLFKGCIPLGQYAESAIADYLLQGYNMVPEPAVTAELDGCKLMVALEFKVIGGP